jgi:L-asparagine transporter-like permease
MVVLEHNYPAYIAIWLFITIFILWYFRFMARKMQDTEDRQTKSSLFMLTVLIGIPLLLVAVLGPLLFIIGDKNMQPLYRYVWMGLIGLFLLYFVMKQRHPKQITNDK